MEMWTYEALIREADMSEEMILDAVIYSARAMKKYKIEKDIAKHIKMEFDKKYDPTWQCVVGRDYGTSIAHLAGQFVYFCLWQVEILLFK